MVNHPNRGRAVVPVEVRRQDGTWGPLAHWGEEFGRDGFGATDDARAATRAVVASLVMGYATRDPGGRARTVVEFSGDQYDRWLAGHDVEDPVIRAFINPRDGSLDREALEQAARLLIERAG